MLLTQAGAIKVFTVAARRDDFGEAVEIEADYGLEGQRIELSKLD